MSYGAELTVISTCTISLYQTNAQSVQEGYVQKAVAPLSMEFKALMNSNSALRDVWKGPCGDLHPKCDVQQLREILRTGLKFCCGVIWPTTP